MTDRKDKFCKYVIQYIEDKSLWLAQSWYYTNEDPTYIRLIYRCWNQCPIEALSELHKSITEIVIDVACLGPVAKSFEKWKIILDGLGYDLQPMLPPHEGKLYTSEAVKKGEKEFIFGFGETERSSYENLITRIVSRECEAK